MALLKNKEPWLVKGSPWKTESAFWVWVRGVLRAGWSKHPVKHEYIKHNRKRILNPNVSSRKRFPEVWGMACEICGEDHVQSNIEIDHKGDSSTFTGLDDVKEFVRHLFLIDFDSIRALCKPCHKIVNMTQKQGITFEQARFEKAVNEKMKLPAKELLTWLDGFGYSGASVSNLTRRRTAVTTILSSL